MSSYELRDKVAQITFDDGKANAVGHQFIDDLNAGLDRAEAEAQAVVLCGRPGMFSAGFDLNEFKKGPEATANLVSKGARLMLRLFTHPQPLVAAASGHAIAAGAFILLASDTRIGVTGEFKVGLNETAIGMTLPVFGLQLALARLAPQHLTQALVQSRIYDHASAVEVGYFDQVVEPDELLDHALAEAAALGELDSAAYSGNKRGARAAAIAAIEASLS